MPNSPNTHIKPSLSRYLAVMLYDSLLLITILLFASIIAVSFNALVLGGQAIESGNPFYLLYLFLVSLLFYGWFWRHGGQTLGMRSWNVYLINEKGHRLSWLQVTVRFISAMISWLPVGLGFWWLYLSSEQRSWPDKLSASHLHYSKDAKKKPLSRLS